jgi:hypothetical protein
MATEKVKNYDDDDLLLLPEFHSEVTEAQKKENEAWHVTHDKKGWTTRKNRRGC